MRSPQGLPSGAAELLEMPTWARARRLLASIKDCTRRAVAPAVTQQHGQPAVVA